MKNIIILFISSIVISACDNKAPGDSPSTNERAAKYVEAEFKIDVHTPTVGIHDYKVLTADMQRDSAKAREIIKAKVLLPLAMQGHDAVLFDSVLASGFIYQDEDGLLDRDAYIDDRVNGKWMISDVQYKNLVLEFIDDYVIMTYWNQVKEKDEFGKDQLFSWYWMDVWVEEKGRWKVRSLRAIN